MSKKRNLTPRNANNSLDDEINIKDYPYYKNIPIDKISQKQKKILDIHKISKDINKSEPLISSPSSNPISPGSDIIIPRQEYITVYDEAPIRSLPTFNLVPVENEINTYQLDVKSTQDILLDLLNQIEENNKKLNEQQQCIVANEETLHQQTMKIDETNNIIHNNTSYINQQLAAYNHNIQVLHHQGGQYNMNNNEILKQGQIIMGLNSQVEQLQSQVTQLHQDLESYQQQIAYHGTMLSAFNTMIQNPEYFTQLMTVAMNNNVNTYEDQNNY